MRTMITGYHSKQKPLIHLKPCHVYIVDCQTYTYAYCVMVFVDWGEPERAQSMKQIFNLVLDSFWDIILLALTWRYLAKLSYKLTYSTSGHGTYCMQKHWWRKQTANCAWSFTSNSSIMYSLIGPAQLTALLHQWLYTHHQDWVSLVYHIVFLSMLEL